MHPAIRVCHFVSSTSRCWSRACMCCPRAVARSVGLVRRHRCPRTQTRSVTLGVRGSPAPGSAVRPVRASTLDISRIRLFALARIVTVACRLRQGSTERYRLTVRSGRRPCDAAGGALLRLLRALRSRFGFHARLGRLGPRLGSAGSRNPSHSIFISSKTRSRDSSAPAAVRGVAAPASRRAVPCGLRLGYVL